MAAAHVLCRIIDVGNFGAFRRDGYLFLEQWNCVSNVVKISHIIAESDFVP